MRTATLGPQLLSPAPDRPVPAGPRLKIAVSGASGLVGRALVSHFTGAGHQVLRIVRSRPRAPEEVFWDQVEVKIDPAPLEGLDAVIHLAGEEALSMRWSEQKKMNVYGSRVRGTELLAKTLARLDAPPRAFLSASAIGYYGNRGAERLTEASLPSDRGFLACVCQDWERATAPAADAGIRTVQLRLGVVLAREGGGLGLMLPAFELALGGRYGAREQYLSWIARDDVLHAIDHLLRTDLEGPVNLTAPEPVTMQAFARTLGRVLHRPAWLHLPARFFRLLYGEVAEETILLDNRVLPERLLASGYHFLCPDLEAALRHELKRPLRARR